MLFIHFIWHKFYNI